MSTSTEVQTELNTLIEATLPTYDKLPDRNEPEDNPMIILDKGYATSFGPAVNNSDIICKGNIRIERSFSVILTNAYTPGPDPGYRESLERALLDDVDTLIDAIECNPQLNGKSINSTYSDDGGIEYLTVDGKQFILIILTVTVEYFQ